MKHVYSLCEHMFTHRVIVYSVQCQWKMKETYTSRGKMRFSRSHLPQNNVAHLTFQGFWKSGAFLITIYPVKVLLPMSNRKIEFLGLGETEP